MMHEIINRVSPFGGEGALALLLVLSIISMALIAERMWWYSRTQIPTMEFMHQLTALLRAGRVEKAAALAHEFKDSVSRVALAGLNLLAGGDTTNRAPLDIAHARERTRLQQPLVILKALGNTAILIGIAGGLCDLLALGTSKALVSNADGQNGNLFIQMICSALAPVIGGVVVAIPARLAAASLQQHVTQRLLDCDLVSQIVAARPSTSEEQLFHSISEAA